MVAGENTAKQRYTYGLEAISVELGDKKGYYLNDELGSPIKITNKDGKTETIYSYDAFGTRSTVKRESPYQEQILSFTGYQQDIITGLHYAQARYYMPEVARFNQEDMVHDGDNWYNYCSNDPVNYIDPSGEIAIVSLLLKAGAGGAVDFLIQLLCNTLFNEKTQFKLIAITNAISL